MLWIRLDHQSRACQKLYWVELIGKVLDGSKLYNSHMFAICELFCSLEMLLNESTPY